MEEKNTHIQIIQLNKAHTNVRNKRIIHTNNTFIHIQRIQVNTHTKNTSNQDIQM